MTVTQDLRGRLWSDEPSKVDFLAARAIAETVSDAVLDDALDPLAIGLSGPWGSGKTTVLELIKDDLESRSDAETAKILTVRTDPWRYDPAVGAKESLIGEVLDAISAELSERLKDVEETKGAKIKKLLKKLSDRIDWAKAVKLAATSSLTLTLPGVDKVLDLIREPAPKGTDQKDEPRGLAGFKAEFAELLAAEEMSHIRRVAVLVDDLDRCLVDTVVETLEAIRLFLSVEGMAFVIAADEDRVADAIRTRLPEWSMPAERPDDEDALPAEPPSKLYLHKIVQTTVPLPALGAFDTESYVLLLQLQNRIDKRLTDEQLATVIAECHRLRAVGALDDLKAPDGLDVQRELSFARRLTTILYEKLRGNPRRIKRFLNDLNIRRSIAARRGIDLDYDVVAKLMVLEVLLPDQFQSVLSWLRTGELRDRLEALETQANRPKDAPATTDGASGKSPGVETTVEPLVLPPTVVERAEPATSGEHTESADEQPEPAPATATVAPHFGDDMIRWAKLPPDLHELDLSPYLHLAASFRGDLLVSAELPQHLRDLAALLASTRTVDRRQLSEESLLALTIDDVSQLLRHLGLRARDRVQEQRGAVAGIARLAKAHPAVQPAALEAFRRLPTSELQPGTAITIAGLDIPGIKDVINALAAQLPDGTIKKALTTPPPKGAQR
ncbi:KAP family P-loop NTPase fold protein [Microbacterium gorillae]|uniref:KAP family P-loop NTPase fold protein n=1 Tax=Microbacterium gorillae TaxID=1231063 RepID=UPI00058D5325|nr:P-loop NTPase fold protein [Microbacterium gorillae]